MSIAALHDQYIAETGDKYPEKPKRIWVSKLRGVATQAGSRWIEETTKWDIRFLDWMLKKIKSGTLPKGAENVATNDQTETPANRQEGRGQADLR